MKRIELITTINEIETDGIFVHLQSILGSDWLTVEVAKTLDLEFYYDRSSKLISPLFVKLLELNPFDYDTAINKIAKVIALKYKTNWDKVYEAYNLDYNPLENYNSEETENVGSKTRLTSNSKAQEYAFNSSVGKDSNNVNNVSESEANFDDNKRVLTRKGNIGVTTSQQMLQSEIELRRYKFYDQVISDVDDVLCLGIWGC